MSIKSINEPDGPGRTTMVLPASINEPPKLPDMGGEIPTPAITSIDPSSCTIGDASFRIYLSGEFFFAGSVINFAGNDELTTLEDDGRLSTGINMPLWLGPDTVPVTVKNGDKVSNEVEFTFMEAGVASGTRRRTRR
jgi:hypothetical protein